jgi:hypothetical protein
VNTGPFLHVYGQAWWHNDAIIVGDEAALYALRNAIDYALLHRYADSADVFVGDGEGFNVRVLVADSNEISDEKFPMPYSDDCAKDMKEHRWDHLRVRIIEAARREGAKQ